MEVKEYSRLAWVLPSGYFNFGPYFFFPKGARVAPGWKLLRRPKIITMNNKTTYLSQNTLP